ncbi:MAG: leucine-rich repeat domain-containing protein [Lachnospiraceae bacterium]|nr:leucine-rich repeat domain-containing protein [Lachnospiraceae bacterium]
MREIWTEQIKKRFRNIGILAALCVVIGIAAPIGQNKEKMAGESLIADAEMEEECGEELPDEYLMADAAAEDTEAADADTDKQCGGYCYKILADDTVEITAYQGSETTLFIPTYIEDKPVRVIGVQAFKNNKTVERIYLPQGVVEIGEEAFAGCEALQDIYITEDVERIGKRALADCPLLEEIVFPKALSMIENMMCQGDTELKQITIQPEVSEIAEDAFTECESLRLIYGESEFAQNYAETNDFVYVDMERVREEGNLVW